MTNGGTSGHIRKAVVNIDGGDVLVLHRELSAGSGVEAKERKGRAFPWEEPVVGLDNNERKAVDARIVALKERLFAPFDIDFENEGNVLLIGLGSEQGWDGHHVDLWSLPAQCRPICQGSPTNVSEM